MTSNSPLNGGPRDTAVAASPETDRGTPAETTFYLLTTCFFKLLGQPSAVPLLRTFLRCPPPVEGVLRAKADGRLSTPERHREVMMEVFSTSLITEIVMSSGDCHDLR